MPKASANSLWPTEIGVELTHVYVLGTGFMLLFAKSMIPDTYVSLCAGSTEYQGGNERICVGLTCHLLLSVNPSLT